MTPIRVLLTIALCFVIYTTHAASVPKVEANTACIDRQSSLIEVLTASTYDELPLTTRYWLNVEFEVAESEPYDNNACGLCQNGNSCDTCYEALSNFIWQESGLSMTKTDLFMIGAGNDTETFLKKYWLKNRPRLATDTHCIEKRFAGFNDIKCTVRSTVVCSDNVTEGIKVVTGNISIVDADVVVLDGLVTFENTVIEVDKNSTISINKCPEFEENVTFDFGNETSEIMLFEFNETCSIDIDKISVSEGSCLKLDNYRLSLVVFFGDDCDTPNSEESSFPLIAICLIIVAAIILIVIISIVMVYYVPSLRHHVLPYSRTKQRVNGVVEEDDSEL